MKIIGLTGGIATGKSAVSSYLQQRGYPVVDCDCIARQVVEPGSLGLQKLVAIFGRHILQDDGTLNRVELGKIIFEDAIARQSVNNILHPLIFEEVSRQVEMYRTQSYQICFVDMPLLFEVHYEHEVDEVWLVYVKPEIQVQRLMQREDLSEKAALQKIQSQMPIDEKIPLSDVMIDNSGELNKTYRQIENYLHRMKGAYQ